MMFGQQCSISIHLTIFNLYSFQQEMFRALHAILRCTETRGAALNLLEHLLACNSKRAQMLADRRHSSSDGFLLNLLFVFQQLNGKVKLSSVSIVVYVHLSIYLFIYLSIYLFIYITIYLSIYLFIYITIYLSISPVYCIEVHVPNMVI